MCERGVKNTVYAFASTHPRNVVPSKNMSWPRSIFLKKSKHMQTRPRKAYCDWRGAKVLNIITPLIICSHTNICANTNICAFVTAEEMRRNSPFPVWCECKSPRCILTYTLSSKWHSSVKIRIAPKMSVRHLICNRRKNDLLIHYAQSVERSWSATRLWLSDVKVWFTNNRFGWMHIIGMRNARTGENEVE